jgi:alkanesulfonate monooxygenase SsuD/methylene tetrahydromethanopterin reductase-like flavin-dependent oxidoreductase (luciferase family)
MANPKIIVQAFAALDVLYPERIGLGLGLGTGEAMNEVPRVNRTKPWLEHLNNN